MQASKIEWTDRTWNPVTGCTKVSQGCKNCYAEKMHERFNGKGSFRNVQERPERLQQPYKWKTPSLIFVNSMSDIFHEDVSFDFIDEVFSVMLWNPHHIFQIVTKRADRMLAYYKERSPYRIKDDLKYDADNIWVGVSVEDQKTANERIPLLLQVPAAVRFLSCEPLLEPIVLSHNENGFQCIQTESGKSAKANIDWVIVGGESGHRARPMHPDWARSLRDQCKAAGVPFFFKQWGEYMPYPGVISKLSAQPFNKKNSLTHWVDRYGNVFEILEDDGCFAVTGTFLSKNDVAVVKVGKSKSGNYLDGVQHLEFPK